MTDYFLDDNVRKARDIRKGIPPLRNPDGSSSTHRMSSGEISDKHGNSVYIAFPTLFPGYQNEKLQVTEEWGYLPGERGQFAEEAYQEARRRNEIFTFKTKKEAEDFALGGWKP